MQLLVSLVTLWLTGAQVQGANGEWHRFQEDTHRVSFAYPPELHPVTAPGEHLRGIEGLVNRVSLLRDDIGLVDKLPVLTVDVFICGDPALNPRVPCWDEASYRRMCDRFEKLPVGDSVGIQCVTYGRAACAWSIMVLREKGRLQISAPAAEHAANLQTTDRTACADGVVAIRTQSPLKEMLASFRFPRAK